MYMLVTTLHRSYWEYIEKLLSSLFSGSQSLSYHVVGEAFAYGSRNIQSCTAISTKLEYDSKMAS